MNKLIFLFTLLSFIASQSLQAQTNNTSLMNVDYKSLVSKADLNYDVPAFRSEEGMPVGNGRMGSLVWTTPSALHFQINRVDAFAMGRNTIWFPYGHTSYSDGCGYVDINMVDYGDDVFSGKAFNQHLSVYEGLSTVKGSGVTAKVLAWVDKDVIATEIDDQRNAPSGINIDLRMLRYSINYIEGKNWELTRNHAVQIQKGYHIDPQVHTATSRLDIRDGRIILVQEFREADFYCSTAVAIGMSGRKSKAVYYNESTVRLSAEPGKGKFTILSSSASSFNPEEDVADLALKQLDAAQLKSFDELLKSNRDWWGNYWSKSFIRLHSADGVADNIEKNYTYYLYIMGSCSRGEYMPGFRGMLWRTNGDLAMWGGGQYWWNNEGFYYNGLTPANHPELLEPVFKTFSTHFDSYARAAKQQWGSKGIWIPETTWFNGLEELPDSIAKEMRDLYLVKKPWSERSQAFMDYSKNVNEIFDVTGTVRGGMPNQTDERYDRKFIEGEPDTWSPYDKSKDGYWKGGKHWSEVLGDEALGFIEKAKNDEDPFFMYVAFNAPHDPRQSPKEYVDMYPVENISIPESFLPEYPYCEEAGSGHKLRDERLAPFPRTEYSIKVNRQEYYAIISHMDAQIGRILDALEASGKAANTYIIFTADHGLALGDHGFVGKQNMYDRSVRVPFFIAGPNIEGGIIIDEKIYLQDAMATSLDIAGSAALENVDFNSLLPFCEGKSNKGYDAVYGAYVGNQRMIRTDQYKMIIYPTANKVRLYDIQNNLADELQFAEVLEQLRKRTEEIHAEAAK